MTVTAIKYNQITEDKIEELCDNSYSIEDIHEFIETYGEDNFVQYYEKYVELGEDYSYHAVDTFIEEFCLEDINSFEDSYQGAYSSGADFAQQMAEDCGDISRNLPSYVEIDWEATWENLSYDYLFSDGLVFNSNF